MIRKLIAGGIGCFVLYAFFLAGLGYEMYFLGIIEVLFGWISFIRSSAAKISINWNAVLTGALCILILFLGTHRLLSWLYSELQPQSAVPKRIWQPRWTVAGISLVLLMFVAGICCVGATHQIAWLANSPQPLIYNRRRSLARMHELRDAVEAVIAFSSKNPKADDVRKFCRQIMNTTNDIQLIVFDDEAGNFKKVLAMFSNPDEQRKFHFVERRTGSEEVEFFEFEKLSEELSRRD